MPFRSSQRGLTLIEVLVCLVILSGGAVYVVMALARSAEVERILESRYPLYPILASKIAEAEARILPEQDPLRKSSGAFSANNTKYNWSVLSRFEYPDEEKEFKDEAISSALIRKTFKAGTQTASGFEGLTFETYARAIHFQEEGA